MSDTVCVCVFFPSILDIKFVGRTSRGHTGGRSHMIFNPPSFCGACLDFCREKDSAIPFPRRPWSRILCTTGNELIVLHPLGIFILVFYFLVRKIPFAGIELTSQRVRRLRGAYWATGVDRLQCYRLKTDYRVVLIVNWLLPSVAYWCISNLITLLTVHTAAVYHYNTIILLSSLYTYVLPIILRYERALYSAVPPLHCCMTYIYVPPWM